MSLRKKVLDLACTGLYLADSNHLEFDGIIIIPSDHKRSILRIMKRNWIKRIAGGMSFTAALFVFQACYGTPQDFGLDMLVEGQVKSKTSGQPIEGIKVSDAETGQYLLTGSEGEFSFYTELRENPAFRFEDIDSTEKGHYLNKDTIVRNASGMVYLNVFLEEK